jgi:hypothetical protein
LKSQKFFSNSHKFYSSIIVVSGFFMKGAVDKIRVEVEKMVSGGTPGP